MDYESALWEVVQATVVANVSGVAIGDAIPDGRAALQAVQLETQTQRHFPLDCGIFLRGAHSAFRPRWSKTGMR